MIGKTKGLVKKIELKLKKSSFRKKVKEDIDDIILLKDMLKSQYKKEFNFSKKTLGLIIFALIYLVNPMDLIPDMLLSGFIDDLSVIGWTINEIKKDIERYKKFKNKSDKPK